MSSSHYAPIDLTGEDDEGDSGSFSIPNAAFHDASFKPNANLERRTHSHMSIPVIAPSLMTSPIPRHSSSSALFPHFVPPPVPPGQEPLMDSFPPPPTAYTQPYTRPAPILPRDVSGDSKIIDLTASPSPPPQRLAFSAPSQSYSQGAFYAPHPHVHAQKQHLYQPPQQQTQQAPMGSLLNPNHLPSNLPPPTPATPQQQAQDPKRPACIGQLSSTALVLYPIPYLFSHSGEEWVPVRLKSEITSEDKTVSISTPPQKLPTGEQHAGEQFGIVEAKVGSVLGPMMAKGLIRADAKVQRARPNVPILPLQLLLFTPLGNIPVIGPHLFQSNILLNHPTFPFDVEKLGGNRIPYLNPHNPPPGGWASRTNNLQNRLQTPAVSNAKSVEMPRSQADAMFKNLRSGEELEETEPPEGTIASSLYPHQKKALTFLLEREGERPGAGTLWQAKVDPLDGSVKGFVNSITNKELEAPDGGKELNLPEEKGSLLADDMGLGKTITTVSLIASTMKTAEEFSKKPIISPTPPPKNQSELTEQMGDMSIQNAVWMPRALSSLPLSKKEQAKLKATEKAASSVFARESRIKTRSRATLIICPLSTVANWEEQFREHWGGQVVVVGGGSGSEEKEKEKKESKAKVKKEKEKIEDGQSTLTFWRKGSETPIKLETMAMDDLRELGLPSGVSITSSSSFLTSSPATPRTASTPSPPSNPAPESVSNDLSCKPKSNLRPLRIYIYHGNARRPDPTYLADFDAVITTYATLASEYSRQLRSISALEDGTKDGVDTGPGPIDEVVSAGFGVSDDLFETGMNGSQEAVMRITGGGSPRGKKAGSSQVCGVKRKKLCASGSTCNRDPSVSDEASSPLQCVWWFRVVLDEAHSIKETSTVASRASCDLYADRRLCLTGTPVQNKLDDVYALVKFLHIAPFDDKAVWTEFIGGPVKFGQSLGITRLQAIMKCLTLRRTKESKAEDGSNILSLPPRRDQVRMLQFDEHEKAIYDGFFQESKAEFNELSDKNEVMKNYVGILQKILRLRQICDHFELVQGKEFATGSGSLEDVTRAIEREGLSLSTAAAVFSFLREGGTNQCVECGCELGPAEGVVEDDLAMANGTSGAGSILCPPSKKARKAKAPTTPNGTRPNSPTPSGQPYRIVLTRCQHLFCISCFRQTVCSFWPGIGPEEKRPCAVCHSLLVPTRDAVEVTPDAAAGIEKEKEDRKKTKKEKRIKGSALMPNGDGPAVAFNPSTKIKALLHDLYESSKMNPYSRNYDNQLLMVDANGQQSDDAVIKTVVFSQWTTMLDKIEDGLELFNIHYERLDGTMKREERSRAMDELKYNKSCEVLLVSLRAGGVGLNLTAAQRVYLMDPYWNPAVENQAVDRIHRLGQKKPVTTIKLIIENSIEARLLEVQKKKTALANMTLAGTVHTKAEIMQRRMEELNELFGS